MGAQTPTHCLQAGTIVLMIFLISKCKVNAAIGILIAALVLAIALKTPWQDIEGTINSWNRSGHLPSASQAWNPPRQNRLRLKSVERALPIPQS